MAKNGESETIEVFAYTQVKAVKFKYMWTINNFRLCCVEECEPLLSPKFSTDCNDSLTWRLIIHPNGKGGVAGYCSYLSLYLQCMSNEPDKHVTPVTVECKISILNENGSVVGEKFESIILFKNHYISGVLGFPRLISINELLKNQEGLTLNQTISIICEMCVSSERETNQIEIPESALPNPYELLFENPQFSDVTLSANGTDFKVHKAILATHSQVFEAMFNANMQENLSNRVEITDLNEVTLRELLRFIYTEKVLNLEEIAEDLLRAADKYALRRLKVMCETELIKKLSITNAVSFFIFADMHSANHLKSFVINFIRARLLDIVRTSEWKMMVQEHPKLAVEV